MRNKIKRLLFAILPLMNFAQVGINTDSPSTTFQIKANSQDNPENNQGIIIPRVTSLNRQGIKPNGLMVFLESSNASERGFWYWNRDNWYPFISYNMLSQDRSASVYESKNQFEEGNFILSVDTTTDASENRTIRFKTDNSPLNNDNHSFVNSNGRIQIKESGKYDISSVVTLNVIADNRHRRDSYEFILRRITNSTEANTQIRSSYGFPNAGTTYNLTNSVALNGVIDLLQDDELEIRVYRYNRGTLHLGNVTGASNSMVTNVVSNLTNITLRRIN